MTENEYTYYCTRPKLASVLIGAQFRCIRCEQSIFNPNYKAWIFEKTPALMAVVNSFYEVVRGRSAGGAV